jgi:long-chain acyl-CoA synthetase
MLNADFVARASDAAARIDLESSLANHLKQINTTLDPHERLQCLVVVTTAWTVDNDVITPTFKVKRNRIEDLYAKNYDHWEAMGRPVIWQNR